MTDWSTVGAQDVRAAIEECNQLGSREFLGRYRFGRAHDATVWHDGEEYDARALMGLAHERATGSTVPAEEFATGGEDGAVLRLRALGFDVVVDETLTPAPPKARKTASAATATATATKRATAPRPAKKVAPPKRLVRAGRTSPEMPDQKICPHCFMAIPATGLCDNCD